MADWIVIGIIAVLLAAAIGSIIRAKKSGQACIGCPHSGSCKKDCHCGDK